MRWRGLAKAGVRIRLTAIAYNMKRNAVCWSSLWQDSGQNITDHHTRASEDTVDDVGVDIFPPFTPDAKKSTQKCFPCTGLLGVRRHAAGDAADRRGAGLARYDGQGEVSGVGNRVAKM